MKTLNEQINPKFINQAKKLEKYTALLRKILPAECLNHVKVANIRDQNLMLIADSPVWTTRLRQLSPQILRSLHDNPVNDELSSDNFSIIHHVQISTRYQPSGHQSTDLYGNSGIENSTQKKPRHTLQISSKTAELLSQSANSINDPQLKKALLRVASHSAKDTEKKTDD